MGHAAYTPRTFSCQQKIAAQLTSIAQEQRACHFLADTEFAFTVMTSFSGKISRHRGQEDLTESARDVGDVRGLVVAVNDGAGIFVIR